MILKIQHARALGYCIPGIKMFIEKHGAKHGYTFKKFMQDGVDERILRLTGDHMALEMIKKAKENGRKQ